MEPFDCQSPHVVSSLCTRTIGGLLQIQVQKYKRYKNTKNAKIQKYKKYENTEIQKIQKIQNTETQKYKKVGCPSFPQSPMLEQWVKN